MLGALVSIVPLVIAAPAQAQAELQDGPKGLVITYRTTTAKRPAFRTYLTGTLADEAPRDEGAGQDRRLRDLL